MFICSSGRSLFRLLLSGGIGNSTAKAFKSYLQAEHIALSPNIKGWMLLEAGFDTLRHLRRWQVRHGKSVMLSFMAKEFWLGVDPQAHSDDVMRVTVDSLLSMWGLLAFTKCPEKFMAV